MPLLRLLLLSAVMLAGPFSGAAHAFELKANVVIEGLDPELAQKVRPFSRLAREGGEYKALASVNRAARTDTQLLKAALQSEGYYAARVAKDVRRDGRDALVRFEVTSGPRFEVRSSTIRYTDDAPAERPDALEGYGIDPLRNPSGAAIADAERKLQEALWTEGYIGSKVEGHRVEANFAQGTADIIFEVSTGPISTFRSIIVEGAERTDDDFIRQHSTFEIGELAARQKLDSFRKELSKTSLFSEIDIRPKYPETTGETDVLVRVRERPHRTLGGGVSYSTDIGPAAEVFWENRNFLRRGETLRAELVGSAPLQEASLNFRKGRPRLPGFYSLGVLVRNEDTDAFNAQTFEIGGLLGKFWFDENLTTEGGLRYQYSKIASIEESRNRSDFSARDRIFQAVSVPLSIIWNHQDQPLDPQSGLIAGLSVTPYFGTVDFTRVEVQHTSRLFWGPEKGGTVAGRLRLGATYGATRQQLPATERFFAGGGGSIRGYAFQEASPISTLNGDILGGASLAEVNLEVRQHLTKDIEFALFTDFGGAFENNTPDFENVLVGAGAGIRYSTPIGPLRVDFAIPVDRREIFGPTLDEDGDPVRVFQDPAFQFYIALGQPF